MARLANDHVLFFFFGAECVYCQTLATDLAQFSGATGMQILPVSLDGSTLPEFPNPRTDNGIARRLGINTLPAVFLAAPGRNQITPLGFGPVNSADLVDRIVAIANPSGMASVDNATPTLNYSNSSLR